MYWSVVPRDKLAAAADSFKFRRPGPKRASECLGRHLRLPSALPNTPTSSYLISGPLSKYRTNRTIPSELQLKTLTPTTSSTPPQRRPRFRMQVIAIIFRACARMSSPKCELITDLWGHRKIPALSDALLGQLLLHPLEYLEFRLINKMIFRYGAR